MTGTKFLMLCDHAAGKSLLAATYLRAACRRRGVDVDIDLAGPDPDAEPMPMVAAALDEQGFGVGWLPRRVSEADIRAADQVINVGCALDSLPIGDASTPVTTWDVPMLSADFAGSMEAIHAKAEDLARTLAEARRA